MASKPLRPCQHPGCTEFVRGGYCAKHRHDRRSPESREWKKWYSLTIWTDDLRPSQLLREPFCRECARCGKRTWATVADHIVPFEGDWARFIDPTNHQSLCASCHGRKTARETHAKTRDDRR